MARLSFGNVVRSGERGQPELQLVTFQHALPPERGYGILALMDTLFAWQITRINLFGWNVIRDIISFHIATKFGGFSSAQSGKLSASFKQSQQMIVRCFESSQPQLVSNKFVTIYITLWGYVMY